MRHGVGILGLSLLLGGLVGCQRTERSAPSPLDNPAAVTAERMLAAPADGAQWIMHGGDYSGQRFSPLRQIDAHNVDQLRLAWQADYGTGAGQHGAPLYIDGVLYVLIHMPDAGSSVLAVDARTGAQLWQYDAHAPAGWSDVPCCDAAGRGIAAYQGRIIMGTPDARLVAIDARTGKQAWATDTLAARFLTMAPRIVQGKVLIGSAGAQDSAGSWMAAFDADTGRELWRFHNVPGDPSRGFENEAMKRAVTTWGDEGWKSGNGAAVEDGALYDPATDLFIYGTGSDIDTSPEADAGDHLYTASLIALKAGSGEYVWHYQTTPAGSGRHDATNPMLTMDVLLDDKPRHVLVQPNANGFLYMLDVATGQLLGADAFTKVEWATGVDMKTGRPDVLRAAPAGKTQHKRAPLQGRHSTAYSPDTGLLYMAMDTGQLMAWDPVARRSVWEGEEAATSSGAVLATAGGVVFHGADGQLRGHDAKTGRQLWHYETQSIIRAPPISYQLDGRQYLAASVDGVTQEGADTSAPARLLVFALDGAMELGEQQH